MEDAELEEVIVEYVREHLSPTAAERVLVSRSYETLQRYLQGRTFQSGSYARHTSTTPVNDLDVIYVIPETVLQEARRAGQPIDPANLDIHRMLETLAAELQRSYGRTATVRAQPHSVGIFFGDEQDFSIDVVPAVPVPDGAFMVPEIAQLSVAHRREAYRSWTPDRQVTWIRSHPKAYIDQASALDLQTEGRFRKATKLLKKWRWHCKCDNEHFRFKSFHLELAVTERFRASPRSDCTAIVHEVVGSLPELIEKPSIQDLADHNRYVDQYVASLSDVEKSCVLDQFRNAQLRWAAVEGAHSPQEARGALKSFLELQPEIAAPTQPAIGMAPSGPRDPGEEFLSDYGIPVRTQYRLKIDADVTRDGFRPLRLLGIQRPLFKLRSLKFFVVASTVPEPFEVRWKVKNTGSEARRKGQLRGKILRDDGRRSRSEHTQYWGQHYVECYAIKDGVCVALDRIGVPIGTETD